MRCFNVFGRCQQPEGACTAVISELIRQLYNNENPSIHGKGKLSRDFTYIDNVILENLLSCLAPSDAVGKSYMKLLMKVESE